MSLLVPLISPSGGNKQALHMEVPCLTQGPTGHAFMVALGKSTGGSQLQDN